MVAAPLQPSVSQTLHSTPDTVSTPVQIFEGPQSRAVTRFPSDSKIKSLLDFVHNK